MLCHRRLPRGQGHRHGRAHQHHHANLLLRHFQRAAARGGHCADQEGHSQNLCPQGPGGRGPKFRRRGPDPGRLARSRRFRRRFPPISIKPRSSRRPRPILCSGSPRSCWPTRAICCPSAPSRWMAPGRPPRPNGKNAPSPWKFPNGTPRFAFNATNACWSARTPPSGPSSYPPASAGRRARPVSNPPPFRSQEWKDNLYSPASCARRLHRLHPLRGRLPGQIQDRPATQGDQHEADAPVARAGEASITNSSSTCPRPTARACRWMSKARNSASRCSSIPGPAPAAAKRLTSNCSRNCPATA